MTFYQQCLATGLELNPYPDGNGQPSTDPSARIMHGQLVRGGAAILMASDTPQPGSLQPGNNFSVSIHCDSLEEAERFFAALSRGGVERMPLTEAPWGAKFGMLTDQFGIQWLINFQVVPQS
jgi:PhnB protein